MITEISYLFLKTAYYLATSKKNGGLVFVKDILKELNIKLNENDLFSIINYLTEKGFIKKEQEQSRFVTVIKITGMGIEYIEKNPRN